MGKRILFISPTGTLDNGAEKSIANLMIYLSKNGYKIYNAYPENSHYTHSNYVNLFSKAGIKLFSIPTLKWWWEEAPGGSLFSKEERVLFYQQNIKQIRDIIKREKIELVISNTVNVFQGSISAACEGIPHFWLIHEFPDREFDYYKKKIGFIFENSDGVFSVYGNLSDILLELSNNSTKLDSFIPFSNISDNELTYSEERRIVSIGMINENKNQFELLRAYASLNREDIPLVFIGDWEETIKRKCDEYITKYSLKNVHFMGYKDQPWDEVTTSDICVFNSKSESFSLVFVESILKGVPSIVSNISGYRSAGKYFNAGVYYALGNIENLTSCLSDMIENFNDFKTHSLAIREHARKLYSEESCFDNIISKITSEQYSEKKSIIALESLLGNTIPKHEIFDIKSQSVVIYYSKDNEEFSENNKYTFPFQYSDQIYFNVPDAVTKIRVDLSEIPNYIEEFKLTPSHSYHEEVQMFSTNGFLTESGLLFGKNDPQITYDISHLDSNEFIFSYKLKNTFKIMNEGSILTELADLHSANKELIQKYKQLSDEFTTIINSKRWRITSKIINFFRRK